MDADDGQAPVLIRVVAIDAEPGGGAVRGLAWIDIGVTETGASVASPESRRCETSAAIDLGSLADPGMLRELLREQPLPDAVASFRARTWDVFTPEVIGDIPIIDVQRVVRAVWPDLPDELETDPVALLARVGGTPMMAATVPQPDLALAQLAEATAMLLGPMMIGTVAWQLPGHVGWCAEPSLRGPDRGVRDRMKSLIRLSAVPLTGPTGP